jgi:hypothetical protein
VSPPNPPRPGSHSAIDVVAPGAVNEYREPSFGERPTVPPIPPDAVPRAQLVPRKPTQRGMPAQASEQRPPMSNPPLEDGPPLARPRARQASQREREVSFEADVGDRPSRVEQEEFGRAVHAKYGKASFSGPAWVFLALLGVGLLGVNIYLFARRPEAPPQSAQCLTKDQFEESMRIRDERTSRRFDTLETDTSYLKVALRLLQDRQPAK